MATVYDSGQMRIALAALETVEQLVAWMARRWKDQPCPECGAVVVQHVAGCELDAILSRVPPPVDYAKDPQPAPESR